MDDGVLALLEREVKAWPGTTKAMDRFGDINVTVYTVGRRQIGHVHHDGVADLVFPRTVRDELIATGRAEPHPAGFATAVSAPLRTAADVPGVVERFRLGYDRTRRGATAHAGERGA